MKHATKLLEQFFNVRISSVDINRLLPLAIDDFIKMPVNQTSSKDSYLRRLENIFFDFEIEAIDAKKARNEHCLRIQFSKRLINKSVLIFGEVDIRPEGASISEVRMTVDGQPIDALSNQMFEKLKSELDFMSSKKYVA